MKVSAIQQFRNKVNYNNSNQPAPVMSMPQKAGMSYADGIQNNGNYGKAQVMMKNNPSFGSMTVGGVILYYLIVAALYGGIELASILKDSYNAKIDQKERMLEEARIKAQFEKDVIKLANVLDMSPKKAEKYYEKFLGASYIPQKGKAMEEVGLNAVRGYSMEKYELMKDVLSPVVLAQKAAKKFLNNGRTSEDYKLMKAAQKEVPNGILFYGPPGTGKTYLAQKICEHAKQLGADFMEISPCKESEQRTPYSFSMWGEIDEASRKFQETGKYTFVLINESTDSLKESFPKRDTLLDFMDKANTRGLIFVSTINKPTNIDPAYIRKGRFQKIMQIGKMEKFEVADMINYALQYYIPKAQLEKFDIQKVVDKVVENDWNFTPDEYLGFVQEMNASKFVTADELIDTMQQWTKATAGDVKLQVFAKENMPKYQKEIDYVKQLEKEQKKPQLGAEDESIV